MATFRDVHAGLSPKRSVQRGAQGRSDTSDCYRRVRSSKQGMSHYYNSGNYIPPPQQVMPTTSSLYTPSGRYSSSKYFDTQKHGYGSSHNNFSSSGYDRPINKITDKYSGLSLSTSYGHRPNISTSLLLEQNIPKVPLSRHSSDRGTSRQNASFSPALSRRKIKSEESSNFGRHTKKTLDLSETPTTESSSKSPVLRKSRKYKGAHDKSPASTTGGRHQKKQIVTFEDEKIPVANGVNEDHGDEDEDEMKEGVSCCENARWIGCGRISAPCIMTADRGYLIWNRPKEIVKVIFRYGNSGQDFSCFMDPQFPGVKVLRDRQNGKFEEIIDGVENPKSSRNRHLRQSACRNRPENNFEFDSKNGEVRFILEALETCPKRKIHVFKINYTLAL